MANVVEVEVRGSDKTGPALESAAARSRKLNAEVKTLGNTFNQFGALVSSVAGTNMGQLSNAIEQMVLVSKKMGTGLAGNRTAMLGFAASGATAAASLALAGTQIAAGFFEKIEAKAKSATDAWTAFTNAVKTRRDLIDPSGVAKRGINESASAEIDMINRSSMSNPEKREAANQVKITRDLKLRMLAEKEDTEQRVEAEKLVAEHREKNWELYDAISEAKREKDKELSAARMKQEEDEWSLYEAIQEHKRAMRDADDKALMDQANKDADEAEEVWAKQRKNGATTWRDNIKSFEGYTGAVAGGLGQLASIMEQGGKKQFKTAQALRYGEAVMSTASGIARCYADYPLWLAIPMSAIVAAAGAAQIAAISGAKGPQAHSGIDRVHEDSTFFLKQGEMVLDPGTSEEVRNAAVGRAGGGGGGMTQVIIYLDGAKIAQAIGQMSRDGRLEISAKAIAA